MTEQTEQTEPHRVTEVRELLELLELTSVRFVELSARLAEEERDAEMDIDVAVTNLQTEVSFNQRFRMSIQHPRADLAVEVETGYTAKDPITYTPEIGTEFIERVAIMAAFPFLREGLASLASKLELPVPILGLLRAGQFKVTAPRDISHGQVDATDETSVEAASHIV